MAQAGVRPAADERGAVLGRVQAEDHPHRGGLARAVRADETGHLAGGDRERHPVQGQHGPEALAQAGGFDRGFHVPKAREPGGPRSSRPGAVFIAAGIPRTGEGQTPGLGDAVALTSGDNRGMDSDERPPAPVRPAPAPVSPVLASPVLVSAVLALLAVAELAARLTGGSAVRAGLRRPVPAAVAVWLAAMVSLVLFELVTVAGAAALVMCAYRLARAG